MEGKEFVRRFMLEMAVEKKASLAAKNWFWQSKKRPLES